jgi:hypothetical protein
LSVIFCLKLFVGTKLFKPDLALALSPSKGESSDPAY